MLPACSSLSLLGGCTTFRYSSSESRERTAAAGYTTCSPHSYFRTAAHWCVGYTAEAHIFRRGGRLLSFFQPRARCSDYTHQPKNCERARERDGEISDGGGVVTGRDQFVCCCCCRSVSLVFKYPAHEGGARSWLPAQSAAPRLSRSAAACIYVCIYTSASHDFSGSPRRSTAPL